jgi:peptidoglycan/LPS O-acetylase OafA/YrhL
MASTAPTIPGTAPTIPETAPTIPGTIPTIPGTAPSISGAAPTISPTAPGRDPYLDLLRAGSLLVVVVWHWAFTVLSWQPDGPRASNPIGHTPGLWLATWVLQVMPLFFFVGGYVHLRTWRANETGGGGTGRFLARRLHRLAVPAAAVLVLAGAVRLVVALVAPDAPWVDRGLVLLVSPLWFLGVYLALVLITPLAVSAHRRFTWRAPLALVAVAVAVDRARLSGVPWAEWINFLAVFGFAHQLGFWWDDLVALSRRWVLAGGAASLGVLAALTTVGPYPRSMVGVPGEALSNLAPPTICILALCGLQVALVLWVREAAGRWLVRARVRRATGWLNANAMGLYLWHFCGYAAFVGLMVAIGPGLPGGPDGGWWVQRPLWIVGPALCTVPLLRLARRLPGAA